MVEDSLNNRSPARAGETRARETTSIEDAARRLGIGRTTAYDLARRNQFPVPVIRAGRIYRVPVATLDRALGIEADNRREPVAA